MTSRPTLPEWAQDAALGIFVHWGPYSVPAWAEPTGAWGAVPEDRWFTHNAYAEWYANTIRIPGSPAAQHQADEYSGRPYLDFLDEWQAEHYDPTDWARLFASAGADYVIPVTKHHDGVTLWDAPGAAALSTAQRGPRRDLIAPLAQAVRSHGIRFGVYYSGGLDWAFTDFPPIESMADVESYRPTDAGYAAYATAHLLDLIDRFQPSVIWNDINWPDAGKADGSLVTALEHYRSVVPDGIVNDRWGADVADYRTSEYSHDVHNESGVGWEHNRGLGFSFGYNRIEDESLTLSPRELARLFADVVSRGGRLLLNVGPDASGRIPPVQRRTLEGIAPWMSTVKSLTAQRAPLDDGEVVVEGDSWWRAWESDGRIIVITEDAGARARALDGRECVVVALPVAK
jgi:alpha-L-fucosidase